MDDSHFTSFEAELMKRHDAINAALSASFMDSLNTATFVSGIIRIRSGIRGTSEGSNASGSGRPAVDQESSDD